MEKTIAERIKASPEIAKLVAKDKAEDTAAVQALADAAPGPVKNLIKIGTGIKAGRWVVRRFCDWDYELLKNMGHPFSNVLRNNMIKSGIEIGTEVEDVKFEPRGPGMWQLAWIFTRGSREVATKVSGGDYDALKLAAENEFGECRLIEFHDILKAIFEQVQVYWSPNLEYEPIPTDGKEPSQAGANPTESSVRTLTVSDGCGTSVAD